MSVFVAQECVLELYHRPNISQDCVCVRPCVPVRACVCTCLCNGSRGRVLVEIKSPLQQHCLILLPETAPNTVVNCGKQLWHADPHPLHTLLFIYTHLSVLSCFVYNLRFHSGNNSTRVVAVFMFWWAAGYSFRYEWNYLPVCLPVYLATFIIWAAIFLEQLQMSLFSEYTFSSLIFLSSSCILCEGYFSRLPWRCDNEEGQRLRPLFQRWKIVSFYWCSGANYVVFIWIKVLLMIALSFITYFVLVFPSSLKDTEHCHFRTF